MKTKEYLDELNILYNISKSSGDIRTGLKLLERIIELEFKEKRCKNDGPPIMVSESMRDPLK